MGHNNSKKDWLNLSPKEQENLYKEINGTRIVPPKLSGHEIDNLMGTAKKKGFLGNLFSSGPKPTKDKLKNFDEL